VELRQPVRHRNPTDTDPTPADFSDWGLDDETRGYVQQAAAFVLSFAGLITALNELGTCLEQQGKLEEAQKVREQIDTLTREKERLEQLIHH
jgi:hypothetical protein